MVFPNPFPGSATFTTTVEKPQTVYLYVQNLVGQVVAKTQAFIQPGENGFDLSLATAGVYTLTLTTEDAKASYKIICSSSTTSGNSIQYLGVLSDNNPIQNNQNSLSGPVLKVLNSGYTLGYAPGDIIHYRCRSSTYTTVLTDSPASSKNYEVAFAACTDPDGKNYSIVKIGTQTWMAENLAYLPSVNPSSAGSETTPYYYVYGYNGINVSVAKATGFFGTYGVLYNWPAAMSGASSSTSVPSGVQGICPPGWHLPSDSEWTVLTDYLTNNGYGYEGSGSDIGKSMAATSAWDSSSNAGDIGNNPATNNRSGFTALPGGYRYDGGGFWGLGGYLDFWSSSEYGLGNPRAWQRSLDYDGDGVSRASSRHYFGFSVRCLLN